jgi:hypothetical protein
LGCNIKLMETETAPGSAAPDPHLDAIPVSARLVTDPQFRQWQDQFVSFMSRARQERNDPEALLDLQVDMARLLLTAQQSQRDAKASAAQDSEILAKVCQRLQLIIRQIADGIAWRALDFDRAVIRLLASKPQTGHMELGSVVTEMEVASKHVERTGDLVVVNDLTNFLRYGDLLAVGGSGVAIYEVKAGKGAAQSGHASRQKKRLKELLQFVSSGKRPSQLTGAQEMIITLKSKLRNHTTVLAPLIRDARATGQASARISDSVALQVLHVPPLSKDLASGRKEAKAIIADPFSQSRNSSAIDSLALFKFSPNVAPYPIFPLEPSDCVDVLTGAVWIVTYVSWTRLVRCLRRRSLWARIPTEADRRLAPDGNVALVAARGRGQNVMLLPWAVLTRLAYELQDEESFADAIEEELGVIAESGRVVYHIRYADEHDLWD